MSNFKQAVSWMFHGEELDLVQDRFDLTDEQLGDAIAVSRMFRKIMIMEQETWSDVYDEINAWSKESNWTPAR